MMLFIKRACKFWVALSVLLGVFTETYAVAPTAFTAPNGTTGSNYSFNLQTMPGAAVDTGPPPAPLFSSFVEVVTVPSGALPNGLNFDATSLITGTPTLAGTYRNTYQIIGGTGFGRQYLVTFNIFAPAAAGGGDTVTTAPNIGQGVSVTLADITSGRYSPVLSGGTLVVNSGEVITIPLTLNPPGGTISLSGNGSTAIFGGSISGAGSLTVTGAANSLLYLSGTNTYTGGTIISSGQVIGNTNALQGAIVNNGTLHFAQADYGIVKGTSTGTGVFSGTISGTGAIDVLSGKLTLSGTNTYSGITYINSGATLEVQGFHPTGTGYVIVTAGSTLTGSGIIAGGIDLGGTIHPGNSPGYLSVAKNFTLNSGSSYLQDISGTIQASNTSPIGASGYYSFVNVGGQLTINSGATLTPRLSNLFSSSEAGHGSSIYVPVLGDRFRIITAAGGITGRFTTLTQPAELNSGTQMIALYNANNSNSVDLAMAPMSYGVALNSSTRNAKSVADVLDQLLGVNKAGTSSSAQDSLLYAVAGQTAANLADFAPSLAGEIHASSVATLPQTTQRVQQSVLARLGDYPMAPSQLNPALNNALLTGGISATNTSGLPTANMSTNPAVNPNAVNVTSAAVADGRAWGEIAYQRTERASNSAGNGYNSNLYQIVTGVDAYSDAELGLKLGGGIALSNTTVSANGGNSTIQQGSLFVYGKMSVLQDYVLDGMASVGMSSTNLSRNDPTGFTGGFSSKAVMGNEALVSVGLSRAFEYNDLRVTPYARLSYQYVGQNSYDEGSGAAALDIARFSGSALRGVIGVAAGSLNKDPLKDEYTYRANVAVGADTSGLLNPTLNTTLGGYSSSVTTASAGSAFVQVGLYGTVKIADNAYAYAGVSGEARSGQTLYGGSVGLRLAF